MLAFALALINGDEGFAFCTATGRYGWLVPLVAGLVIGAVSLSLVGDSGGHAESATSFGAAASCTACGASVMEGSRICPSCGHVPEREPHAPGDSSLRLL